MRKLGRPTAHRNAMLRGMVTLLLENGKIETTYTPFCYLLAHLCSPNPDSKLSVCPLSLSLAATQEIDVSFSSSGYLDVSVPRVPSV